MGPSSFVPLKGSLLDNDSTLVACSVLTSLDAQTQAFGEMSSDINEAFSTLKVGPAYTSHATVAFLPPKDPI